MAVFDINRIPLGNHLETQRDTLYYDTVRLLRHQDTQGTLPPLTIDMFKGYDCSTQPPVSCLPAYHLKSQYKTPEDDYKLPPRHFSFANSSLVSHNK